MCVDEDFDNAEFERFFSLSEAEQDREEAAAIAQYNAWWDALTAKQQANHIHRRALEMCLKNRNRLKDPKLNTIPYVTGLWKQGLRSAQKRLLHVRIHRATGVWPSTDS